MKNIYVILIKSNTKIGFFIRKMTGYEYNHVIISVEDSLEPMYSFSRYNKEYAFDGGFVEESWLRYINSKKVKYRVFKIPINDDKYIKGKKILEDMFEEKEKYQYSYKEAIMNYLNLENSNSNKKFTCLSFSTFFLKKIEVIEKNKIVNSIKKLNNYLQVYEYEDRKLNNKEILKKTWGNDKYLELSNKLYPRIIRIFKTIYQ